jgi:hypothetical protein
LSIQFNLILFNSLVQELNESSFHYSNFIQNKNNGVEWWGVVERGELEYGRLARLPVLEQLFSNLGVGDEAYSVLLLYRQIPAYTGRYRGYESSNPFFNYNTVPADSGTSSSELVYDSFNSTTKA